MEVVVNRNEVTMNEIMTKTYALIDELEKSEIIKNITFYKERIMNNKELKNLIDKGNNTLDEYIIRDIRQKLYKYSDYKNYMDNYNKLMYITMDINSRFNKLINNKNCHRI